MPPLLSMERSPGANWSSGAWWAWHPGLQSGAGHPPARAPAVPKSFAFLQGGLGRAQDASPCQPREGALGPCSQGWLDGAQGRQAFAGLWVLRCMEGGAPEQPPAQGQPLGVQM